MQVELRPRTLGENLGLTLTLALAHFWKLLAIVTLFLLPQLVLALVLYVPAPGPDPTTDELVEHLVATFVPVLAASLLYPLSTGACIAVVASSFTGVPTSLADGFRTALVRFVPLILYALVTGVIVAVGIALCFVPGMIFSVLFYVGPAALIVERRGAWEAITRSVELGRGARWEIFALMLVLFVALMIPTMVVAVPTALGWEGAGPILLEWLVGTVTSILWIVAPVVVYFDQRVKKEHFDVESLAGLVEDIGRRARAPQERTP